MSRGDVTPLAEERLLGNQHPVVVAAMWVVTRRAGVGDRRMLPEIRAALLRVTAGARLVNRRSDLQKPQILRAMHVVAGRAGQLPLAHRHVLEAVLLVDDVLVTGGAHLHL